MAVSVMSCQCLHHTQTHRHVSALCPRAELGGGELTPPRNRGRTHFECQPSPDIHSFIHSYIHSFMRCSCIDRWIDGSMDRWIDLSVKFSFLIESARALEQCFGTFGSISRSPFCSWRCRGHSMHPCIQPSSHDRVLYTARAHARIAAARGEVTIVMDGIQWMAFTQQEDLTSSWAASPDVKNRRLQVKRMSASKPKVVAARTAKLPALIDIFSVVVHHPSGSGS